MKKYAVVSVVAVLFIFASLVSVFGNDIIWDDIGRGNLNLRTVLISPDSPHIIYIGASNAIMKSEDDGKSWRDILSVRGQNKAVNFLLFDPADKNSLYAATQGGLFYSANQGKSWNKTFKAKNYLESECSVLAVLPYTIYLGTRGGLFISKDKGRSWHKESAKLGTSQILAIAYNIKEPHYIYVACIDGVFKTQDSGESWERIFVANPAEGSNDTGEEHEDEDEEERNSCIRYMSLDPNNLSCLYLATAKGVYRSPDRGKSWESLSSYGLLNQDVRFLLISKQSEIYAATKSGVFEYKNDRWQELSLGMVAEDINFLALDNQGNLYAACDRGLFKAEAGFCNTSKDNLISLYNKDEPGINEVQQAAINYAEVAPEKIARWRKLAAIKACLPRLSAGVNRDTGDLWHWEGGSSTKSGDDILVRGRDAIGWDINLTWDLGELIWNPDQTSIDVRSKLMVQLREDILDEVTKLYFERIRVKMEMDNLSIEDRKKRLEKELRLQELTAYLDAMTGGYFSRELKNNS